MAWIHRHPTLVARQLASFAPARLSATPVRHLVSAQAACRDLVDRSWSSAEKRQRVASAYLIGNEQRRALQPPEQAAKMVLNDVATSVPTGISPGSESIAWCRLGHARAQVGNQTSSAQELPVAGIVEGLPRHAGTRACCGRRPPSHSDRCAGVRPAGVPARCHVSAQAERRATRGSGWNQRVHVQELPARPSAAAAIGSSGR